MIDKTYAACGGAAFDFSDEELDDIFSAALSNALADLNNAGSVIILPPDITRLHSKAGFLVCTANRELGSRLGAVLPALGTHTAMTSAELDKMFAGIEKNKFLVHDWRNDVTELGRLEADWIEKTCEGAVHYDFPVQVNKILPKGSGNFSMILSIGQVSPHEVAGMANHGKNLFVGTGGKEAIDKSHFAGAAYGMEKIMGRIDTPVRRIFNEGLRRFSRELPPVLWVLTVVSARTEAEAAEKKSVRGSLAARGLFIGFGGECFEKAAKLAQEVNINIIDEPVQKAVVYLDPDEYRTTWLGNKAIYRTRMAIADNGELMILAPGLRRFGEDLNLDALIRKYGYRSGKEILEKVFSADKAADGNALCENLSAAAHLIHGSSEGRFTIRYCTDTSKGKQFLTKKEIESAGFKWGDLNEALSRYNISKLNSGWNTLPDGERIFFTANPGIGLWAEKKKFCPAV
ncbi:MAG: lactate racemase domain-containing protein [Treponema sp.]|nr:lactate racemase domain-containing protein [Treponema sp.]